MMSDNPPADSDKENAKSPGEGQTLLCFFRGSHRLLQARVNTEVLTPPPLLSANPTMKRQQLHICALLDTSPLHVLVGTAGAAVEEIPI